MRKKKFIDKKHSTTFVIGHRSQRDPLLTDETAPQNILIPLDQVPDLSKGGISAAAAAEANNSKNADPEKRKEEQRKYGVYFDDDYDYLQHLKGCNEVSTIKWDEVVRIYAPNKDRYSDLDVNHMKKEELQDGQIKLPSSVFESKYREDVGLLNKSAPSFGPRPDLDPDVVAALDDDFEGVVFVGQETDGVASLNQEEVSEIENSLLQLLTTDGDLEEITDREPTAEELEGLFCDKDDDDQKATSSVDEDDESNFEDEEDDSLGSLDGPQFTFRDEETKSHFTNYSMSSSCVKRNKQLLLVDDRFEKFFESYEDTEIGALDCDEIEGDINPESDLLIKYAEEFEKDRQKEEELNEKIATLVVNGNSSDEEDSLSEEEEPPKEKWDCQSIISTYSSTKNRPKVIKEPSKKNLIKVSGKTGIPVGVLGKGGLTKDNLKILDDNYNEEHGTTRAKSIMSGVTSIRAKNETTEERRARKLLVKEYRKERRQEKKANTTAFKEEKKRLEKVRLNSKVNVQGLKL